MSILDQRGEIKFRKGQKCFECAGWLFNNEPGLIQGAITPTVQFFLFCRYDEQEAGEVIQTFAAGGQAEGSPDCCCRLF